MAARNAPASRQQQLTSLLNPVVRSAGYDLEEVNITAAGRRSLICVVIDSDTGVDLDAVAGVARAVSEALDDESAGTAAFAGPYVLEVSSPGIDRLLTEPRHWRRAVGRLVHTACAGVLVDGRIVAANDSVVKFELATGSQDFVLATLAPGRVQVEFSRPGQPDAGSSLDGDDLDADDLDTEDLDAEDPDAEEGDASASRTSQRE